MIDYYEQLAQEEKEEVTEVIQTLYRQTKSEAKRS